MEMIDLQDKFAISIANSVKVPWQEIRVHYENANIEGAQHEIFTAHYFADGSKQGLRIPLDVLDLLLKLKGHKPEAQQEEWKWLEFGIDSEGQYKFDYKYSDPPLILDEIRRSNN